VLEPEDELRWLDPHTPVDEAAYIAQARFLPTEEFLWWKAARTVHRVDPSNKLEALPSIYRRER